MITMKQFLTNYLIPFVLVFIVLSVDEYRKYKKGHIDYKTFLNSMSMLIWSLIMFILCQGALSI